MRHYRMIRHQLRFDLLASFRNPRARFFTVFFPILLLVIFSGVFGSGKVVVDGERVTLARFYVPGILAMSIITASYGGLVQGITTARENGVFKRRRATPVPAWLLVVSQALSTLVIALGMGVVLLTIARAGYGVAIPASALVAVAITVVVGTLAFACLGYAVAGMIDSPDSAQPLIQATMLPLYFISGIWIPTSQLPDALKTVAEVFPIYHLANALHVAFVKPTFSAQFSPKDLLILGVWAVAAAVFAARRFTWLPKAARA